jgi:two-component system NtrC family sensor kinase
MPSLVTAVAGLAGALIALLAAWRREWEVPLHAMAVSLLGLVAWFADERIWWPAVLAVVTVTASFWVAISRGRRKLREAESKTDALASQLDRRISELFSLQELSYVLSESIQLDRIVDQVARYAGRFLQTDGAIVVLDDERGRVLRVAAATGTLESLQGQKAEEGDVGLVRFAISRERIEVAQGTGAGTVNLIAGTTVRSAAVAPLRSQGVTMGALAVADRQGGPFTTEDLWLLSTVATNASVVLANSRLYEIVRQSKEEWETAFDALTEGIAVVGPAGAVLRANRALAALAEMGESELVGQGFCEALFGGSDAVEELIRTAYRGRRTAPLVVRMERNQRVLRLTAAPFADQPGRAQSAGTRPVVILVEDVTEQRILEAQLIQNDKMASIGQLVSGVAHELNNPLTSIAGLTELLLERSPHPDFPHEHLRVIHDQAERAGRIVRNLLTFARKGVAEKTAVDLNDVATRTSLLIVYELQLHGIELESDFSPEPVVVLGDRYELQQVLLNLVNNAVHAVSQLEAGRPRRIRLQTSVQAETAVLRVCDSGPGVPPHLANYLFTPFFTTKAPGEGTGLGLSLSYGLVKAHGGELAYEAPLEGGAEFRITLPAYRAPDDPPVAEPPPRGEARPASRRILVVDDDPAVHRMVSALFAPQGAVVEAVRSGGQGLRMLKEREFDLVVADAMAAVGPSELFVQAVASECPELCGRLVVGVSGNGGVPESVIEAGARGTRKPFNLRDLNAVAQEIFASTPPRSPAATEGR